VPNEAARFENLVASHLLKWVHYQQDVEGIDAELRYFRDIDLREVDFVVLINPVPVSFIDCKLTPGPIGKGLNYLRARFPNVDSWQISASGDADYLNKDGIRVRHARHLLSALV
jgi:uncharacterized protein